MYMYIQYVLNIEKLRQPQILGQVCIVYTHVLLHLALQLHVYTAVICVYSTLAYENEGKGNSGTGIYMYM